MRSNLVKLSLILAFISTPVLAQEIEAPDPAPVVAPEAPAEVAETPKAPTEAPAPEKEANFVENNLVMIVGIITGLLAVFGGWTKIEASLKSKLGENKFKIFEMAKGAALRSYQEYVRDIKAGKADGKLTAAEATKARKKAIGILKEEAKTTGIDIVKVIGASAIPALIEKAVNALKKDAKDAK